MLGDNKCYGEKPGREGEMSAGMEMEKCVSTPGGWEKPLWKLMLEPGLREGRSEGCGCPGKSSQGLWGGGVTGLCEEQQKPMQPERRGKGKGGGSAQR